MCSAEASRVIPQSLGTVLVVDDADDIREVTIALLELEGFGAHGARNGREALAYLRSNPQPLAVLLDLMMPVMSGYELRDEMLRDAALAATPVFVVSASCDGGREAAALEATAHFRKPVRFEEVLAALHSLFGTPPLDGQGM
jgi:CheY-like chemotaxis protein